MFYHVDIYAMRRDIRQAAGHCQREKLNTIAQMPTHFSAKQKEMTYNQRRHIAIAEMAFFDFTACDIRRRSAMTRYRRTTLPQHRSCHIAV